jgi:hypothetical protein
VIGALGTAFLLASSAVAGAVVWSGAGDPAGSASAQSNALAGSSAEESSSPAPTTTVAPYTGWVNPASVYQPFPGATVSGLLTFRGNPTRNYYGAGPVPQTPKVTWQYPDRRMCADSWEGTEVHNWCGNGWTGQPAVFERDGRTWVVFGAYDRAIHVVDGVTGEDILPPFFTGDIIKGSVTIDPDGYPLIYTGSRDNKFRVLAFDRPQLTELWSLDANAVSPTLWNDDWDSSALVLHDWLFEGGENSQIHAVKLNRAMGADKLVTVAPDLEWHAPGWDAELLHDFASYDVSIETSVAVYGNTLYFTNSGGLVQGWDIAPLLDGSGEPQRVFRFWAGDDTDGTITVDEDGMLYLGVEWERHLPRASEVGQMLKLDPSHPDNPLVWSLHDDRIKQAGVYSSAGLVGDLVIYTTYSGRAVGVDRATGTIRWEKHLPGPLMGSPVIVDGMWLQGDCSGVLHAFDVHNTLVDPPEVWSVALGGCIEATPAVWNGRIYVGTRAGFEYSLADA